ncbi:MAG TPA: LuxR C-terminal-related transcriptional regulator [Allosphingosinicella sp.]|jgi:DNA-binding NarL/FixJ family response regulator
MAVGGGKTRTGQSSAACRKAIAFAQLSARAARLAEEGLSNLEVGEMLQLSPGTVRNYLSEAAQKLGAGNRIEAGRIARANGWL